MIPSVIRVIEIAARTHFSADDTIKPIVSYIGANIQEGTGEYTRFSKSNLGFAVIAGSPRSVISRIDLSHQREKAEMMLEMLVTLLCNPALYAKFTAALPMTRICLLFLGDHPSSFVTTQVLLLIATSLRLSSSFERKFELVNGWTTLHALIPGTWEPSVHEAAFDILLGRSSSKQPQSIRTQEPVTIGCSHIFPVILVALRRGLEEAARRHNSDYLDVSHAPQSEMAYCSMMHILIINLDSSEINKISDVTTENLLEELINLQASSSAFRSLFRSQANTQIFIDAFRSFVGETAKAKIFTDKIAKFHEQLSHFALSIVCDNEVAGYQKQEVVDQANV